MEQYKLPDLPYGYKDLEPYMSEETLKLHHDKHHLAYVNGANTALQKLQDARSKGGELDYKSVLKTLSFNVGGHLLHEIFWKIMAPASAPLRQSSSEASKASAGKPAGELFEAIERDFGSFEQFKKEFSETAKSVEGSGWALLVYHKEHGNLAIIQMEKHNVNLYPEQKILLCLDVWEHAYYVDYKNDRAKFIENWWNIVNWDEVEKRFAEQ